MGWNAKNFDTAHALGMFKAQSNIESAVKNSFHHPGVDFPVWINKVIEDAVVNLIMDLAPDVKKAVDEAWAENDKFAAECDAENKIWEENEAWMNLDPID